MLQIKTATAADPVPGLKEIKAVCDEWGSPAKVGIDVVAGSYGRNCGGIYGEVTYYLSAACEGKSSCSYVIPNVRDPVPSCAKDYLAEWTCDGNPTVKTALVPADAGRTVSLACQ